MARFVLNETSYHGKGVIAEIATEIKARGFKKEIVKVADLDFLAQSAFDDACRPGNPRATSVEEIKELYLKLM